MIAQIPFFGLDPKQIDEKWVEAGYGLEANIFDGHSFEEADYIKTFNQTLEYAKQLDPSLLTLHFPTDHADYVNEDHIKKTALSLCGARCEIRRQRHNRSCESIYDG